MFSIDNIADEYARLMDASEEVMNVNEEANCEPELNIDWHLQNTVDLQPLSLDSWSSEKVPKV